MSNKLPSELNGISGETVDTSNDLYVVYDTSASEMKKTSAGSLRSMPIADRKNRNQKK